MNPSNDFDLPDFHKDKSHYIAIAERRARGLRNQAIRRLLALAFMKLTEPTVKLSDEVLSAPYNHKVAH